MVLFLYLSSYSPQLGRDVTFSHLGVVCILFVPVFLYHSCSLLKGGRGGCLPYQRYIPFFGGSIIVIIGNR